jgi:hypothetical protein
MVEQANPWVVQAPKQSEPVPTGFYTGPFQGIEDAEVNAETKWRFVWEVATGDHKGKKATALCDRAINKNTLPGRLISGLLGRDLVVGENIQAAIGGCVGQTYLVSVQAGPKGGKPGVKSVGLPPKM